jgi:energy-coupling factor transporter ATP-binding protein EcfA2
MDVSYLSPKMVEYYGIIKNSEQFLKDLETTEVDNRPNIQIKDGTIQLKNIVFGYNDKLLFNNLNIEFNKGTKTAIIGKSGSGKSSLIKLIMGYYKINDGSYEAVPIQNTTGYGYETTIPFAEPGSEISYYLHAVDISGRRKNHPYIGAPDPHVFTVGYAETTLFDPDSLIYLTMEEMVNGQTFNIYNYTDGELVINDIEQEGFGWFHWYIDPAGMEFPYTMMVNETLPVARKVRAPPQPMVAGVVATGAAVESVMMNQPHPGRAVISRITARRINNDLLRIGLPLFRLFILCLLVHSVPR